MNEKELQRISQQAARVGVDAGTTAEAFRRVAEMSMPTKDTTFAGKAQLSGEDTTYNIEKLREYVGLLPHELTDIAYEAVDALASQPRWIPCSERLPTTEDKVLCCTVTKKGIRNIVIGYYVQESKYWACGMNSNVIAWMLLPEPYEEVKQNDDN